MRAEEDIETAPQLSIYLTISIEVVDGYDHYPNAVTELGDVSHASCLQSSDFLAAFRAGNVARGALGTNMVCEYPCGTGVAWRTDSGDLSIQPEGLICGPAKS